MLACVRQMQAVVTTAACKIVCYSVSPYDNTTANQTNSNINTKVGIQVDLDHSTSPRFWGKSVKTNWGLE